MKFPIHVLLSLCLPAIAFAEVGEQYADTEKRLGKAHVHWTEGHGVTVYCHGPNTFFPPSGVEERVRTYASEKMHQRFCELTRIPRDINWAQYHQIQKEMQELKRPGWMFAYVVEGVCLAEEFFLPTPEAAREIIRQQRNGKGMGDAIRHVDESLERDKFGRLRNRFTTTIAEPTRPIVASRDLDWAADDGRTAFYSSRSGVLIVTHPQWPSPPLKSRLATATIYWCCVVPGPVPKSNRQLLLEGLPWAVQETEIAPALTPIPTPDETTSGDSSDSLLLPR